jgi:mRNA-degrading endonuclease RelE of RelBE toxin-antitoxin system
VFDIQFTESALEDIAWFRGRDRQIIFDGIQQQVAHEPVTETRNRKKLRPNKTAEWEVRIEGFRVFYDADADQETVDVKVVGQKVGSKVCVEEGSSKYENRGRKHPAANFFLN